MAVAYYVQCYPLIFANEATAGCAVSNGVLQAGSGVAIMSEEAQGRVKLGVCVAYRLIMINEYVHIQLSSRCHMLIRCLPYGRMEKWRSLHMLTLFDQLRIN